MMFGNTLSFVSGFGNGILNRNFNPKWTPLSMFLAAWNKAIDLGRKRFSSFGSRQSQKGPPKFFCCANIGNDVYRWLWTRIRWLNMAIRCFPDPMTCVCAILQSPTNFLLPPEWPWAGGCELVLACQNRWFRAETYKGLVEFGVGVIPGGGWFQRNDIKSFGYF